MPVPTPLVVPDLPHRYRTFARVPDYQPMAPERNKTVLADSGACSQSVDAGALGEFEMMPLGHAALGICMTANTHIVVL